MGGCGSSEDGRVWEQGRWEGWKQQRWEVVVAGEKVDLGAGEMGGYESRRDGRVWEQGG